MSRERKNFFVNLCTNSKYETLNEVLDQLKRLHSMPCILNDLKANEFLIYEQIKENLEMEQEKVKRTEQVIIIKKYMLHFI